MIAVVHRIVIVIVVVVVVVMIVGRDNAVGIATRYRLDGPGIESRCGARFSTPNRPWGPPGLLYNGYRVSPGGKAAGSVALTTHPHLAPRLKKSRAIPLLHYWAFMVYYRVRVVVVVVVVVIVIIVVVIIIIIIIIII